MSKRQIISGIKYGGIILLIAALFLSPRIIRFSKHVMWRISTHFSPAKPSVPTRDLTTVYQDSDLSKAQGPSFYGSDSYGTRFYSQNEITPQNVKSLKVVWDIQTGDAVSEAPNGAAFECSPIVSDGNLVVVSPGSALMALNPLTGKIRWRFTPHNAAIINNRGLAVWKGPAGTEHSERIVYAVDSLLYEVDSHTGQVISRFGDHGHVNLTVRFNSPPLIVGDTILCGSQVGDNIRANADSGKVRAFDVHTGALRWSFDPVPHDKNDPAVKTWPSHLPNETGAGNVWSFLSYDPVNRLVYLPTSSPSNDSYGGTRTGSNLYCNSIVCVDAATGVRRWSFQLVHHDLWDYDLPSQPLLFDFPRNGKLVHGVAVTTKMGRMFLFDRLSGQPLFPIKEVPVLKSDVPGEQSFPTQPMAVLPPPLSPQQVRLEDAWGPNPAELAESQSLFSKNRLGAIYTPPSLQGTIQVPGIIGGCNWSGMAYDPQRHLIVTTTNHFPILSKLYSRTDKTQHPMGFGDGSGQMEGTPFEASWTLLRTADGIPRIKPPWGTLVAVDPVTGQIAWQTPLGFIPAAENVPGYKGFGSPSLGGALTTASGLTFVAGTLDNHLRAFETQTGKEVASFSLPAGGQALPMIYSVGKKEYLVICCGGHWILGDKFSDHIVAFALK